MKTCPDCGERVYSRGCVNCHEEAYIEEQEMLTDRYGEDEAGEAAQKGADACANARATLAASAKQETKKNE